MRKHYRSHPKIFRQTYRAGGPEAGSLPPAGHEDGRVPQGQDPQQIHRGNFGISSKIIFGLSTLFLAGVLNLPHTIFAEGQYDIKEMTPEVKAALENRRSRFDQLKEFKARGLVGENNRGYVEVLSYDLAANSVAESENQDRKVIYKAIEVQNNLSGALETIEKVFAQVQRDKASPGDKIQTEDGAWVVK